MSGCDARLIVERANGKLDTWYCQLRRGHAGEHRATSAGRRWSGHGDTYRYLDRIADRLMAALTTAAHLPIEDATRLETLRDAEITARDLADRITATLDGLAESTTRRSTR